MGKGSEVSHFHSPTSRLSGAGHPLYQGLDLFDISAVVGTMGRLFSKDGHEGPY